jgi:predicted permease
VENLLLSFNVVAPLILYMGVGVLLRKTGIVEVRAFRGANNIVFYAALPLLCFRAIAASDLSAFIESPFLLYSFIGILLLYALASIIVPRICKADRRRGVLILGTFRSNDAIFGLGVAAALLGEDHMALMALAIALSVPLFNVLSVITMAHYQGGKPSFWRLPVRILTNPVVVGCIVGFIASWTHLELPDVLATPVNGIASLTTPLAFIALGGTMTFDALKKNRTAVTVVSLLRLLLIPILALAVFLLLGFRGESIIVALIIFGAPVAMATYTMSAGMGADDELAGSLVAVTSVLSIVTMFLFIFALKQLAFI